MMKTAAMVATLLTCWMLAAQTFAQDWPQWRGPNRDGKAEGFEAPDSWPAELTKKWSVSVGDGVSTPALVGDKLFVFSRQDGREVIRCLNADTGEELWQDKYEEQAVRPPAASYSGPRASPAVAQGKVVTYGVHGVVSCLEADTGKLLWRKSDYGEPRFATSSSPIIVGDLCIVPQGGERGGAIVAYDLASGEEKWKWSQDGASYGSPVLMPFDGKQVLVTPTAYNLVFLDASNGEEIWKGGYAQGRYNASTPVVLGDTVIYAGEGERTTTREKFIAKADDVTPEYVWRNNNAPLKYNTPVLKDGLLFGLSSQNEVFCLNVENGETAWSSPLNPSERLGRDARGYGSVVDAGSVMFALDPVGRLVVFEPSAEELKRLATYQVADGGTYAYPIIAGKRVFIKDADSVTLWTIGE